MIDTLTLLITAILFGGMVFYSFGFAPVLFAQLSSEQVRPILRGTFPYYYLVVIAVSAVATAFAFTQSTMAGLLLGGICVSTIYARQILMIQINAATDRNDKRAFGVLHGASVVIQLIQIALNAWALVILS
ncbi:MAG: DUF4149 domain-containing protein [Pseudomonadota bacterium]